MKRKTGSEVGSALGNSPHHAMEVDVLLDFHMAVFVGASRRGFHGMCFHVTAIPGRCLGVALARPPRATWRPSHLRRPSIRSAARHAPRTRCGSAVATAWRKASRIQCLGSATDGGRPGRRGDDGKAGRAGLDWDLGTVQLLVCFHMEGRDLWSKAPEIKKG